MAEAEKEYIEKRKLIEAWERECTDATDLYDAFDYALESVPAADVVEVVHAHWIDRVNDNDIILGLKCLADEDEIFCKDCAFLDRDRGFACKKNVSKAAIDFINRQKEEIERLKGMVSQNEGVLPEYEALVRAEAIKEFKEFADRLKGEFEGLAVCTVNTVANKISNLVKEMTEDKS